MDNIDKQLQLIKRFPLFKDFTDRALENILRTADLISCQENTTLFYEGDRGDTFFVVIQGTVDFYKKTTTQNILVNTVTAGDFFGEMAYFNRSKCRMLTAQAHPQTLLFKIPYNFFALLKNDPKNISALSQIMGDKQMQYYTKIVQASGEEINNAVISPAQESNQSINSESVQPETLPESSPKHGSEDKAWALSEQEVAYIKSTFYDQRFICPYCQQKFKTPGVLSKFISIEKSDSDFCNYYSMVNPLFYEVTICPQCNYGFSGNKPKKLKANSRQTLKPVLDALPKRNYCQVRDVHRAKEAFEITLMCQSALVSKHSLLAWLNIRLAWLCRYQNDLEAETQYSQTALEHYLEVFSKESDLDSKNELLLMYMIGELYNRMGDPGLAVKWFSQLVNHPQSKTLPVIVKEARNRWQDLRAEMKQKKPTN
ncbi:MAG: DUF2225 domain-containing protein [Desulfotomaculum sp.]|nr:DUF2225 domain-containing protein [Desulfotomaculum sp.]